MKQSDRFWLVTFGLFLVLVARCLLSRGMFLDGTYYAAIAKNLAHGNGSMWNLYYSAQKDPSFYGHMPLAIWIEAALFKVFGYSYAVEKMFSALTYVISAFILGKIWKQIAPGYEQISWLPALIMLSFPVVNWAAQNNMLENLMLVFILAATYFILSAKGRHYMYFLSGFMILMAFLSKGIQALFVVSLLFWIWLFDMKNKKFTKTLLAYLEIIAGFVIPAIIIYLANPNALEYLKSHIYIQVFTSLKKQSSPLNFDIIWYLINQIILISALTVTLWLRKKINFNNINSQTIKTLLAVSISGIIPYLVSWKQSDFYLIPALPFVALIFACMLKDYIQKSAIKIPSKRQLQFGLILIFVSVIIMFFSFRKDCRDQTVLNDIDTVNKITKGASTITVTPSVYRDWKVQAYFMRFYGTSLVTKDSCRYSIIKKQEKNRINNNYRLEKELENFIILKRIDN